MKIIRKITPNNFEVEVAKVNKEISEKYLQ
jgi:hypothetical protein